MHALFRGGGRLERGLAVRGRLLEITFPEPDGFDRAQRVVHAPAIASSAKRGFCSRQSVEGPGRVALSQGQLAGQEQDPRIVARGARRQPLEPRAQRIEAAVLGDQFAASRHDVEGVAGLVGGEVQLDRGLGVTGAFDGRGRLPLEVAERH